MTSSRASGGVRGARVAAAGVGIGAVLWWGGQATMTGWAYAEPDDSSAVATQEAVPGSDDETDAADVPDDTAGQAVESEPVAPESVAPPSAESGDAGATVTEPAAPATSEEPAVTPPVTEVEAAQGPLAQNEQPASQPSAISEPADVQAVTSVEAPASPGVSPQGSVDDHTPSTGDAQPDDSEPAAVSRAAALLDVEAPPTVAAGPLTVVGSTPAPLTIVDGVPVVNAPTKFVATVLGFLGFNPFADTAGGTTVPSPALVFAWGLWQQINRRVFNSYPVLSPSTPTTNSDGTVRGSLGASDPDRDVLTYTLVTAPERGTVVINPDGTYVYTPDAEYAHELSVNGGSASGSDSFTVSVSDDTAVNGSHLHWLSATERSSGTLTVAVTILPTNVDPELSVGSSPSGASTVYTVAASDADGDPVTVSASTPAHGTVVDNGDGTWTYTPNAGYAHDLSSGGSTTAGSDSIVFGAGDGHGGADSVTVTPSIAPTNVSPVVSVVTSWANADGSTTYVLTSVDADGDATTMAISVEPQHGSLTVIPDAAGGPLIIYTPDPNYAHSLSAGGASIAGEDSFTVTVTDHHGGQSSSSLTPSITPTNMVPTLTVSSVTPVADVIATGASTTPNAVTVGSDGLLTYVGGTNAGEVYIIDSDPTSATYNEIVGTIASPYATGVIATPDGHTLYVANMYSPGTVSVFAVDPSNPGVATAITTLSLGPFPGDLAISPDGHTLYVATTSDVRAFDISGGPDHVTPTATYLPGVFVTGAVVSPDNTRLYLTGGSSVYVIDNDPVSGTYRQVVGTIAIPATTGAAISPDGSRLYVSSQSSQAISVVDVDPASPTYKQIMATVPTTTATASDLALTPDGTRLYVTHY
ncbi:Ig-like domain-containing protein [Gordonia sp. NPDC003950]